MIAGLMRFTGMDVKSYNTDWLSEHPWNSNPCKPKAFGLNLACNNNILIFFFKLKSARQILNNESPTMSAHWPTKWQPLDPSVSTYVFLSTTSGVDKCERIIKKSPRWEQLMQNERNVNKTFEQSKGDNVFDDNLSWKVWSLIIRNLTNWNNLSYELIAYCLHLCKCIYNIGNFNKCRDSYVTLWLYRVKLTAGRLGETTVALGAIKFCCAKVKPTHLCTMEINCLTCSTLSIAPFPTAKPHRLTVQPEF